MRRLAVLVALVLVLLAAACGDDDSADDADGSATTTTEDTGDETEDGDDEDEDEEDDEAGTTTTSTTVADADAEDPPDGAGGEDEGMGDPFVYVAELRGDTEVPGPGDPSATGRIEIRPADDGRLCIDMEATGLDSEVIDAHIHEGAAGSAGGVVIPIGPPTGGDGEVDTWSDVCVTVADDVLLRLDADASQFYANVHTATFADGAIRGQLEFATIFDLTLS